MRILPRSTRHAYHSRLPREGSHHHRRRAERLARDGATTVLWDIDPELFDRGHNDFRPALLQRVDVTDPDSVHAATDDVVARTGGIDIVINNAGIVGPYTPVEEYESAAW